MGSDEDWEAATNGLKGALEKLGLDYTINEGDGAFYGPKIDFHLEYTAENGQKERPIMIHRVCFGSIERFIGILTEHYAGKFPTWLAPEQVRVMSVSDKSEDYAREVYDKLFAAGIRVTLDDRSDKIGYKIREARQVMRVPYMLIIGAKEVENGNVSVRDRDTDETTVMTVDELIAKLREEISERRS